MPPYDNFIYPTLEVEAGKYVRFKWWVNDSWTEFYWAVVPGSIYADRFTTYTMWDGRLEEERQKIHLYNVNQNVRFWLKKYAYRTAVIEHGDNPPPFYLHGRMKDRMVRWGLKKMKGFAAPALAQCSKRDLEDSSVMFSTLGYGPREWTLGYLKKLEHRDYMNSYGLRLAIGNMQKSDCEDMRPWYWRMESNLPRGDELSAAQKKMAYNAPGGIAYSTMDQLVAQKSDIPFRLPRDRQAWFLAYSCLLYHHRHAKRPGLAAIQRSSLYNIHKGMKLAASEMGIATLHSKSAAATAASYIADCVPARNDTVLDWARRSVAWHEQQRLEREERWRQWEIRQAKRKELLERAEFPKLVKPPPDGVRYLDSREAYFKEGQAMSHCVNGYVDGGILGHHFIFHYGPDGDGATVMIGPDGSIRQNLGYGNRENAHTAKAARIMKAWARDGKFYDKESIQEVTY